MFSWDEIAEQIFTVVTSAGVSADRQFIAPGPSFARDCRLIAVVFLRPNVRPLSREWPAACALIPTHDFQVVFAADCVPAPDDNGNPPAASAVTAWSTAFLSDCTKIFDAVMGAALDGVIAGGCDNVQISPGEMRGPSGFMASMVIPLTVELTE